LYSGTINFDIPGDKYFIPNIRLVISQVLYISAKAVANYSIVIHLNEYSILIPGTPIILDPDLNQYLIFEDRILYLLVREGSYSSYRLLKSYHILLEIIL
jgi:hypothetical protein